MVSQEKIIDRLLDLPNDDEQKIFQELIKINNEAEFKFSSYILANMWNSSKAVKFGFAQGRTAADFMESQ